MFDPHHTSIYGYIFVPNILEFGSYGLSKLKPLFKTVNGGYFVEDVTSFDKEISKPEG